MVTGPPKAQLILDEAERAQPASMARSRSLSAALVLRARIVLACELEASNRKLAHRLQLNPATVGKWRKRFVVVGAGIGRCLDQAVSLERLRRLTGGSGWGLALGRERMCSGSS